MEMIDKIILLTIEFWFVIILVFFGMLFVYIYRETASKTEDRHRWAVALDDFLGLFRSKNK